MLRVRSRYCVAVALVATLDSLPGALHVGDADPLPDNFTLRRDLRGVDVALLPFWYVLDAASRRFVAESIRPARIVASHLPPREAAGVARTLREAGVSALLPPEPGSPVR